MARRAIIVALLAVIFSVTAMRSVAHERASRPIRPRDFPTAPNDSSYSVAAEREPEHKSQPPVDATDFADGSIPGSIDWLPPLTVSQPVWKCNFHAAFEAVSLAREIDEDQVFATLDTPTNDVLNVNDLDFQQEPGMRLVVGARFSKCYAMELTITRLADWDEARAVSDSSPNAAGTTGNLFSPFTDFGSPPAVGLDFNESASIHLISSLDTLEWNLRQRLATSDSASFTATAIYGFRYLGVGELLRYRTESTAPLPGGTSNALDIAIDNHLYGFQLGGTLDFLVAPCWVNLEGKAALCHNGIVEDVNFTGVSQADPPNAPIDRIREEGSTAFVGHLLATIEVRFAENCVGRVGYQALFVDGLALASQSGSAELLHDASAVYHGPIAGVVLTW